MILQGVLRKLCTESGKSVVIIDQTGARGKEELTVEDLLGKAEEYGFKANEIVTAARLYCNQPNIYKLTSAQIQDLDRRMTERMERTRGPDGGKEIKPQAARA